MNGEIVTVAVGGQNYRNWKKVSIRAAVNEACRSFTLVAADARETNAIFQNFTPVAIYAVADDGSGAPPSGNGDLVVTGYVDRRRPKLSARESPATITGRSKGQDSVDCSAVHETGRFENKSALDIAREIDTYGIGYTSDAQLEPIPEHQLTPGETVHREVERLCRDEYLSLAGQPDGGVKLWNADTNLTRHAGGIVEGINLFEGEADHNSANRHSHTHVRGQETKGTGQDVHEREAIAQDSGVPRPRHIVHIHDGNTDTRRVKNRAEHRRDRAAGCGLRASVTMIGWRDEAGTLWTPGYRVWVESPTLDLVQDMLIEAVDYEQDNGESEEGGGSKAHLELVDPRAYKGKGGGSSSSGSSWGMDTSEATDN